MPEEPPSDDGLFRLVDSLGFDLEPSILIGGWATKFLAGGEISRDIDLIIYSPEVRQRLRDFLEDYTENSLHSGGRKGRGVLNGVHIDAYYPHESKLGDRLQLDVAVLTRYAESGIVPGWLLLSREAHLVTKCAALLDRPDSEKGAKDAREIVSLIGAGVLTETVIRVLREATHLSPEQLRDSLSTLFELLPNPAMANKAQRRKLVALRREWLDELERQQIDAPRQG